MSQAACLLTPSVLVLQLKAALHRRELVVGQGTKTLQEPLERSAKGLYRETTSTSLDSGGFWTLQMSQETTGMPTMQNRLEATHVQFSDLRLLAAELIFTLAEGSTTSAQTVNDSSACGSACGVNEASLACTSGGLYSSVESLSGVFHALEALLAEQDVLLRTSAVQVCIWWGSSAACR
jgi:hypothetical protein